MKDRTPTQVLPNGAIRYEEFNESEVSQGYKYLKLADEPLQAGTALNKAFGDASFFVTFAHARIGTNNELTNADGGENIRFVVSANTEATDAWTVNGTSYTLKDQSGETYEAELKAGAIVSCFADNTNHVLNFKSGGAGLNFALKPYATEAALLADTPKENTVGVVTETAISDYTFSSAQPTAKSDGSALSGGEIWVKENTKIGYAVNTSRRGVANLYPSGVYQYTDGVFAQKVAYLRQGSAWKRFSDMFIEDGQQNADTWGALYNTYQTSTFTQEENAYKVMFTSAFGGSSCQNSKDIDFSKYSAIRLEHEVNGDGGDINVYVSGKAAASYTFVNTSGSTLTIDIDVSNINSMGRIVLAGGSHTVRIFNLEGIYD